MVQYIFCPCGKVVDEFEKKCFWCGKPKIEESAQFTEVTDPKIIAETIWMADRPRTWWEWFLLQFGL